MDLMIHSNDEQELSSVYQFIDVLYNLCSMVALRSKLYGNVESSGLKCPHFTVKDLKYSVH